MQVFGMSSLNPSSRSGGNHRKREGLRENKEDSGLMKVFRRLLRTSESNTELYRGISLYYIVLELGLQWVTMGHVVDLGQGRGAKNNLLSPPLC